MGNVDNVDRTLALNEMMYHVRRVATLRRRFVDDWEALAREFSLTADEVSAVRDRDVRRLNEIGVHQYYIPQILRLIYGAAAASNAHPAMEAYKRAYPDEYAKAMATDPDA